jgi:DNA mismatch repair protein MutS2
VESARKYIDEEKSDITELIKGLEKKQRELAGIEKLSTLEKNKLKEEKRKADLKDLQLRQKEAHLKRESAGKLQLLLDESRKTLENLVRELKEGEITREKTLKVKEFLNELAHNVENESLALNEEEQAIMEQFRKMEEEKIDTSVSTTPFKTGMEVFIGPSKQHGILVREDKKNTSGNSWIVKVGSVKMSFPQKDLIPFQAKTKREKVSWAAEVSVSGSPVYELKIRGMRFEEAMESLRRQIESASLSGLKTFSIIHGKGDGILRKGVHEHLKNDPAIENFHFARPEMGGFGRTEVILR